MGIVHRDIKPENFMLADTTSQRVKNKLSDYESNQPRSRQKAVYIIDFGLSSFYIRSNKHIDAREGQCYFVGTAGYSSINSHKDME